MLMKLLNKQIREHLLRVLLTVIFFFFKQEEPLLKKNSSFEGCQIYSLFAPEHLLKTSITTGVISLAESGQHEETELVDLGN